MVGCGIRNVFDLGCAFGSSLMMAFVGWGEAETEKDVEWLSLLCLILWCWGAHFGNGTCRLLTAGCHLNDHSICDIDELEANMTGMRRYANVWDLKSFWKCPLPTPAQLLILITCAKETVNPSIY